MDIGKAVQLMYVYTDKTPQQPAMDAIISYINKLESAVIILDDDAEPMKGDVIRYGDWVHEVMLGDDVNFCNDKCIRPNDTNDGEKSVEIIQRNGKPCVYRSDLG